MIPRYRDLWRCRVPLSAGEIRRTERWLASARVALTIVAVLTLDSCPVQKAALAARVAEESESVLDHFKSVRAGLWSLYDAAVTAGDGGIGSLIAGRLHENLNSIARITGQLVSSPLVQFNSQVNLKSSPRFLEFEQGMLELARNTRRWRQRHRGPAARARPRAASPAGLPALEHHAAAA